MNAARVVLGGFAAGLLLLLSGIALAHGLLGPEYIGAFAAHRAHPVSAATVIENTMIRLAYGFLVAFLYAAIRPRFGAGPRTALVAALFVWVAAFVPRLVELNEFGILTGWRLAVSVPWSLAEVMLATLLAGSIYRETTPGIAEVR
jgi:xanthosine utilization system XapX-like protein